MFFLLALVMFVVVIPLSFIGWWRRRKQKRKRKKYSKALKTSLILGFLFLILANITTSDQEKNAFTDQVRTFFNKLGGQKSHPQGHRETVIINNNQPYFDEADLQVGDSYHINGPLDNMGRVSEANARLSPDLMPAEPRGDLASIQPTGWVQRRYTNIGSGGWLYNRSHLIGYQLTGNDSPRNIMTGTRWMNEEMLLYENWVADYIQETGKQVRYRVTPIFKDANLLARGVIMEAYSIEDGGQGVCFNIFIPNIQPGIRIDYQTGESSGPMGPQEAHNIIDRLEARALGARTFLIPIIGWD